MPDFYYQIKAKTGRNDEFMRWSWPPVFSGMVSAADKKQARALVDDEYGQKFPMRVLQKDIDSAEFLLNIFEVRPEDDRTRGLFEIRSCKQCGGGFRVIDHYNNWIQRYSGRDFCSDDCKESYVKEHDSALFSNASNSTHPPVIYRITHQDTGMSYVGQTTQAFTLRWWQHFFHGTDTKFHRAIEESSMTDWVFQVIEVIDRKAVPDGMILSDHIREREQHWINHLDTIARGYNTATSRRREEELQMMEFIEQERA